MSRKRLLIIACLSLAASGLIILGFFAGHPGLIAVRISPVAFLALLTVELTLLLIATSDRPGVARAARIAIFIVPLLVNVGLRTYLALSTREVLEWDETYYMSLAVTAAHGHGLYPYIFGFGPMAIMGGIGYAAYAYAVAVLLAGPTILGLRVVSLAASIAGLGCIWMLTRALYGSGTAWMAAAIASSLRLFVMSNSVRMDSMAFAYVAGSLLVFSLAWQRWEDVRRHLLAGLVFGLGLQVHIDTTVTALACGALYVVVWLRDVWQAKHARWQPQMFWYICGWSLGLGVFVCLNILPDPEAFYRTTVLVRVDATGWYSHGTSSIAGSFLDPRILIAKETARYGVLFRALPGIEMLLALAATGALLSRRGIVDRLVLTGIAGVLIAASIVLNNASPLYFIHVVPLLIMPMAPLLTHGLTRRSPVSTHELTMGSLVPFVIVVSALCAVNNVKSVGGAAQAPEDTAAVAFAARVRSVADRRCRIAGDGALYVRRFADYPYFISSRPTEVRYAMLYYGLTDEAAYWDIKEPDLVFTRTGLSEGLSRYVTRRGLSLVDQGIWSAPGGCPPD